MLLAGALLATFPSAPGHASQDEVKRELERLGLPADTLSATPVTLRKPTMGPSPEEAATVTALAPLAVIGLASAFGYVGLAAPFTMGAGYFHAGDPLRGTLVGLGAPAVMLSSFVAFGMVGERFEDPSVRHLRGWGAGLLGTLLTTTAFWAWAAHDASQVARRKQEDAQLSPPARP